MNTVLPFAETSLEGECLIPCLYCIGANAFDGYSSSIHIAGSVRPFSPFWCFSQGQGNGTSPALLRKSFLLPLDCCCLSPPNRPYTPVLWRSIPVPFLWKGGRLRKRYHPIEAAKICSSILSCLGTKASSHSLISTLVCRICCKFSKR